MPKRISNTRIVVPVCLALAAGAAPGWSSALPPTATVTICNQNGTSASDPVACSVGGASASATLSPFVGLHAAATGFGASNGALAQVKYSFEVVGGNPGDQVPVDIQFDLRTGATVDGIDATFGAIAGAQADITVLNQGQSIFFQCASTERFPTDSCGVSAIFGSATVTATSGDTSNQLQLRVVAGTGPDPFQDSLAAFAFADPFIFVDPGFAGASEYSIVLTPGVGNGIPGSVPEPAEWLLAISGVLVLLGCRALAPRHCPTARRPVSATPQAACRKETLPTIASAHAVVPISRHHRRIFPLGKPNSRLRAAIWFANSSQIGGMSSRIRSVSLVLLLAVPAFAITLSNREPGERGHHARLAAGEYHTCALLDDGTVVCWGLNNYGQLRDGTTTGRLSPVPVKSLTGVISIAAGSFHTCALLSNGSVSCWGLNDSGQLGNGTISSSSAPVQVLLTNVVALAAGAANTCAVRVDGSVWCWGAAPANQSTVASNEPMQMNIGGGVAVGAAVGGNHACALLADAKMRCWGQNTYGQLGDFDNITTTAPHQVFVVNNQLLSDASALEISAGANFTCSISISSGLLCWGDNSFDQFGQSLNNSGGKFNYAVYSFWYHQLTAFATGGAHVCAIVSGGPVVCSGRNDALQLGSPSPASTAAFPVYVPNITNAVDIAAGLKHTCAAIADGTIRCWGDNSLGQHGNGSTAPAGIDSVVGVSGTFLGRTIAAGNQFSCGRRGLGALACWGAGDLGQLGNSSGLSSLNPVAVTGISNAVTVTTGAAHACLLDTTGAAKCWGDNSRGQLGNGTPAPTDFPYAVAGGLTFSGIAAGGLHTCGVTIDSKIYCWGAGNETGVFNSLAPQPVFWNVTNGLPRGVIATGNKISCVLTVDGSAFCWGPALPGMASLGTLPVLGPVVGIAAGAQHACGLTAFGSVLCLGDNSRGQLGNNSTAFSSIGAVVPGITDAVSVSAGAYFTCAGHANGTVSCWGANDSGELSAIDNVDHLTPTLVGSFRLCGFCAGGRVFAPLQNVVGIATSRTTSLPTQEHACALLASGVVDCWGDNSQGEIGDGTTINRRPTAVNSFLANVDSAATLTNGHVAEVTALINCDAGLKAVITLTLTQDAASASGHAEARCQGQLVQVPVNIGGGNVFHPGAATAQVEAEVRDDDRIVDDTHWARSIQLTEYKEKTHEQ